jgi:hypothetical protein
MSQNVITSTKLTNLTPTTKLTPMGFAIALPDLRNKLSVTRIN